ncbi:MAG: DUF1361 domain-containing protein [Bacteroidota bacterium]
MTFYKNYKWLMPMLVFNTALILCRVIFTWSLTLAFIPWNVFLGVVPLYFSYLLPRAGKRSAWLLLGGWLLFFPNAMYIVTDLFHLRERPGVPQWLDLLILFSAALNGLIMGFLSLQNVEQFLRTKIKPAHIHKIAFPIFVLCGYGIYLGRYLRFNSWDIISHPLSLFSYMGNSIIHPIRNIECWTLTLLFGIWLYLLYRYFTKLTFKNVQLQP